MARPEKNTVDYFPFICGEGKKMYYLEETYGNDGFATFLKILRELANTEYHYLDLSKKTTKMFLAAKCKISIELLENIINDLVELGKFDASLWSEFEVIWCQDFVDSIQDAYKKRSNQCITKKGLRTLLISLRNPKPDKSESEVHVKPQTILEYTKLEKTREKRALEFLKIEKEIEYNNFEMQNKKNVSDWSSLCANFNDTIDIEISQNKIQWEVDQLMPRFRKYVRSWISNENKNKKQSNSNEKTISNIPIG